MSAADKNNRELAKDLKEGISRVSRRQFTMGTLALFAGISEALAQGQSGQPTGPAQPQSMEGALRGSMPPITVTEEQANRMFPVHNEPKIMTMAMSDVAHQAQDLADSIKAGAVAIHVHPRNPDNGLAMINSALLKRVLDATFDKIGDCVTLSHTWYPREGGIDYIVDTNELLEWGEGNKYCQGSVVLPFNNAQRAMVDKGVRWLDAHNVKPCFEFYDTSAQMHFKQLFDEIGNLSKPLSLDINLGKHDSTAIHQDPGSYMNAIANLDIVQKTFPGEFYGWRTGGRNWLPIMTMGIMMGVDLVQVGLEDAYWRWPHRDELIESSAESVKWAVDIANVMGRRVVTDPSEARKIMGIKLTSKLG
ncbi:MAG: hypothetical protein HW386_2167 [Gammaproteobacteria bacterium]|nr:hypothetical protein [Gammaproteobacteria bacterium]